MQNPWLTNPLQDYEGHMAMPDVGQAEMLADEFEALLRTFAPASAAIVGCAGGNGFQKVVKAGVRRLVGLDINPNYLADARARFEAHMPGLELHCADIEGVMPKLQPVQMVYTALVFEYVDFAKALRNLRDLCLSGGIFAALLQLPKEGASSVSPSPFTTLQKLASIMRLVPPDDFRKTAEALGLAFVSQKLITLASGKRFSLLLFERSLEPFPSSPTRVGFPER